MNCVKEFLVCNLFFREKITKALFLERFCIQNLVASAGSGWQRRGDSTGGAEGTEPFLRKSGGLRRHVYGHPNGRRGRVRLPAFRTGNSGHHRGGMLNDKF